VLNSVLLDVFIGLAFFYLLLSLVLASVNEMISGFCKTRNGVLEKAIRGMLSEQNLVDNFYDHPLLRGFSRKKKDSLLIQFINFLTGNRFTRRIGLAWITRKLGLPELARRIILGRPSYISSDTFAQVLADMLNADSALVKKRFGADVEIDRKDHKALRGRLNMFTDLIDAGEREKAEEKIAQWFDNQMERVTGWYKRLNQKILVGIALVATIALNADTIMIANLLWNDSVVREAVVAEATGTVKRARAVEDGRLMPSGEGSETGGEIEDPCRGCTKENAVDVAVNSRESRPFPVGWATPTSGTREELRARPYTFTGWFYKLLGFCITTLLVSLGAPFWFDMLSKLVNLRNAGLRPKARQ
jgi:hypothetical protein